MDNPIGDLTLHAILEVKSVGYLIGRDMWKVELSTYSGAIFDLNLYTNGDEPCPFLRGDFYGTEIGQHGGWFLIRLPQEDIDQIRSGIAEYEGLTPVAKAKRTREMRKTLKKYTVQEAAERRSRRRRAKDSEERCPSLLPEDAYTITRYRCGFVADHSGPHWSGVGAGEGYQWEDERAVDEPGAEPS